MKRVDVLIVVHPPVFPSTENGRLCRRTRRRLRETRLQPRPRWTYVPRHRSQTRLVVPGPGTGVLIRKEDPETWTPPSPTELLTTLQKSRKRVTEPVIVNRGRFSAIIEIVQQRGIG